MSELFAMKEETPVDAPNLPDEAGLLQERPELAVQIALLLIAVLTVCYFASDIILPIVLAFVLNLLFQPGMRLLERLHLPRLLSALLLIFGTFAAIVGLGAMLSGPATSWAQKIPGGFNKLQEQLHFLDEPIKTLQSFLHQLDSFASSNPAGGGGPTITETLFKGTQHFASGFFETLLILLFLLTSGNTFLRRIVEIVPSFKNKRRVVEISQQVEENISAYLVTITMMNACVGVLTALAMWAVGLPDPILWGGLAFCLNYVQIIGPFTGVGLFFLVGLLSFDSTSHALLPAGLYLLIHLIEGEGVTPLLLAKRFTLNPVLVVISLIFWFWMWGVPGAVLAVPMLGITKIICDGLKPLHSIGHFLEG
jgi:predicted PurR-regulated permease PerM